MNDLAPDHPAIPDEAILAALNAETCRKRTRLAAYAPDHIAEMRRALTAALPHLTADDLRGTDAAEEIRTEGWMQGWAAGRDLDGDEDATPYLRDTPAGRALMAEGWDALIESMSGSGEFHDVDLRTMQSLNPYRDSAQ